MRSVIVVLFFAIALAPQSVSLQLDADGAKYVAVATHGGVTLTDSVDCDDEFRNFHTAPIHLAVEWASFFTRFVRLPEFSATPQLDEIKTLRLKLHAVLRI